MLTFRTAFAAIAAATFAATAAVASAAAAPTTPVAPVRNIVLVHGAFADGSGWQAVAAILTRDGYHVSVVQNPVTSIADDVAATKRVLDRQSGPVILVGHSYGGVVITEAGNDPRVVRLVYVAAFAPDEGEQLGQLIASKPGAATSVGPVAPGFLAVDPARFAHDFAADVTPATAQFMAIAQVPQAISTAMEPITTPAWKSKPSYGIVATHDLMINPDLERSMYQRAYAKVTEIAGSHAIYVSQPDAVAKVIERAARGD